MKKHILTVLLLFVTVIANAQLSSSSSMIVTKTRHRLPPVEAGYGQHIDVSWGYSLSYGDYNYMDVNISYIGGYRFNNTFFLGLGAELSYSFDGAGRVSFNNSYWLDELLPYPAINVPVFAHFRVYFLKTRVSPYFALSAGGRFSTKGNFELESGSTVRYNTIGLYLNPSIGLNIRLNKSISLYFSCGYKATTNPEVRSLEYNSLTIHNVLKHGVDIHLGVTL